MAKPETPRPPQRDISQDATTTVPPASAAHPTDESQPKSGVRDPFPTLPINFGRYVLRKLLGTGGMGAVYLGYDPQLDRHVAIKIPDLAGKPGGRDRFLREARAAATISHPNLCAVYDVGECEGYCFLTMPYVEGRPLAMFLAGKPVTIRAAVLMTRQLALAMQEAHDKGIVHRDLKPGNILITTKKQPVIMDFGLAYRSTVNDDQRLTREGTVMGTPAYMSPEQVDGDLSAMGPACDIYSLGVIFYEMLTGRVPFSGPFGTLVARIVTEMPTPPSQLRPEIHPALDRIVERALAKRARDRYPSMKAFAAALDSFLRGEPTPGPHQVANVLSMTPDDAKHIEAEFAKFFPSDDSLPTRSRPPIKRDSHPPRKRKRRRKRWMVAGVVASIVAVFCSIGLVVGIYLKATADRNDKLVLAALEKLRSRSDDADALATVNAFVKRPGQSSDLALEGVGRYLILDRGEWPAGVELVRRISRGDWQAAADAEYRAERGGRDAFAVGNAWWTAAQSETGNPRFKLRWHASDWYEKALAGGGFETQASQRFDSVRTIGDAAKLCQWSPLETAGATAPSYGRTAPVAWRVSGRTDSPNSKGWKATFGPPHRTSALVAAVNAQGQIDLSLPDGSKWTGTPANANPYADNELTVVILNTGIEVYCNKKAICPPLLCPTEFSSSIVGSVDVLDAFAAIKSFETVSASGWPSLAERVATLK